MTRTSTETQWFNAERIRERLTARTVGRQLCVYDDVASTNAVLSEMARAGACEGTVVIAESQSAGRGRGGKPWFSPPGVNLHASVLFRPRIPPAAAAVFSFIGGLALTDTIAGLGLTAAIKWPNDILIQWKKVAGVLVDLATTGDRVEYLVLGVGVNLNVDREAVRAALGDEAAGAATSLREALGREIDRNAFTAAFLSFLDRWLQVHAEWGEPALVRAWRERDVLAGRRVTVRDGPHVVDGWVCGVDAEGRLEIEDARGAIYRLVSGDVRLAE